MKFYVVPYKSYKQPPDNQGEGVYLMCDSWNDFGYVTLYGVYYNNGKDFELLGGTKISNKNALVGKRCLSSPGSFSKLGDGFFSLGQDESYYENLKALGGDIRENILSALKDIAFDLDICESYKDENSMKVSLLRTIPSFNVVRNQFHRIATGGAKLTPFNFSYKLLSKQNLTEGDLNVIDKPAEISFNVDLESYPPTNIHVIIGRNGVGKTFLIKDMIKTAIKLEESDVMGQFHNLENSEDITIDSLFSNVVCIAFSAFDGFPESSENAPFYKFVGLNTKSTSAEERLALLTNEFIASLKEVFKVPSKQKLWKDALQTLCYDSFFQESKIFEIDYSERDEEELKDKKVKTIFQKFSSGHKIILLTLIKLVEYTFEKTLVILDEPETHLHPPLLSAFTRALSDILIKQNGVAIIATHSPIILQEIPACCSWHMQRTGRVVKFEQLQEETFGANVNSLMREVFGLEINKTGFHDLINKTA